MRIRLSVELRIEKAEPDQHEDDGPSGTEGLVIHQDQPRLFGFMAEPPNGPIEPEC